jgi:hypothetical protein
VRATQLARAADPSDLLARTALATGGAAGLPRDVNWLAALASAVEACVAERGEMELARRDLEPAVGDLRTSSAPGS